VHLVFRMSKFRVKGTLDGVTKTVELDRGREVDVNHLRASFEKLFGDSNLTLRYKNGEGRVEALYQNFHLEAALKDCEKNGQKFITLQISGGSGGSGTKQQSTTVPSAPQREPSFTAPSKGPAVSSTPESKPKFCEECGTPLAQGAKFCSSCGATTGAQLPSPRTQQPERTPSQSGDSGDTCFGCKKSVSTTGVRAMDKLWHKECFSCKKCKTSLLSGSFVAGDDGYPLCANCYDENFGKKCGKCKKNISGIFLNIDGQDYHKECFVCNNCKNPFDSGYFMKDGAPLCKNCL